MKYFYTTLFALISIFSFAQPAYVIHEWGNFKVPLSASGRLFYSGAGAQDGWRVDEDMKSLIAASHLWLGGLTPDSQLRLSAETYPGLTDFTAYAPGMLTTDGTAQADPGVGEALNHVFGGNKADVNTHIDYFMAVEEGTVEEDFPDGYTIPQWILDWPAHGDVEAGMDFYLAPFIDYDDDGIYDPANGDYPHFCGDYCAFVVFHDKAESNGGSPTSIGLEIRLMLNGFHENHPEFLRNTVYAHYDIINRSTLTLTGTYAGIWTDFDIGNYTDDFAATHVLRGAMVGYNGDDYDEDGDVIVGFEENVPAVGVMFLEGPYWDADGTDNALPDNVYSQDTQSYGMYGSGFQDGIIDNERFGLMNSVSLGESTDVASGDPASPADFYRYLTGYSLAGSAQTFGGNGFNSGMQATHYYAPGDSDPLHHATNDPEQPYWSDASASNLPRDVRMVGSSGPFTLTPGAVVPLDIAFVAGIPDNFEIDPQVHLDELMREFRLYYNETLADCHEDVVLNINEQENPGSGFRIYPNPAHAEVQIHFPVKTDRIRIYDMTGKLVLSRQFSPVSFLRLDVSSLDAGLYIITNGESSQRLMIGGR